MPNTGITPNGTFSFDKDGKFLNGQVGAKISVTADAASAERIAKNAPFPPGTTHVGSLSASVNGSTGDLNFLGDKGTVSFSGSASGGSSLTVYDNTSDLLKDLNPDPDQPLLEGLTIDGTGSTQFVLLDWNYNIKASAKGSVALGAAGSANFAVDGSTAGLFAVIRGFATRPGSRDALQSTIASWMLPAQVSTVDDLLPGTWILAEVDGSIGIKVGAQFGYNFNWIRKVDLGNLSGDIGLKIQAGVDAAVGFDASGKYLVIVGRESLDPAAKIVRLRLFKMARKGWTFAFNATVGVTSSTGTLLPDQIDDFIAAVFGVHGAQIVQDLKQFDKWTDPDTKLPDLFAGFVSDFVSKELQTFAGDEIAKYEETRKRIDGFLQNWEDLPHTASTLLWSVVDQAGGPLAGLLDFLNKTNGLDDASLKSLIATEIGKTGFDANPIGLWLESVAETDALSILSSSALLAKIRSASHMVLSIMDGKVLENLVQFVDKKLHIGDVEKIVNEADFNHLDEWLKEKLAKFLGKQTALFADLDKIRAAAKAIRDKAGALYDQALKALNHTYTAAIHYTYAKTTTSTALLDVSFDFAKNPGVGAFLKLALRGDFKDLLVSQESGVSIQTATLTHGVKRQSHLQFVLPYFSDTIDHINTSLATMNVKEENGRLFVYDFKATDVVTRAQKWSSSLTITGTLKVGAGVNVFVSDADAADAMTFSYGLRQAQKQLRDVHFEHQVQPLVTPYFPKAFGGNGVATAVSLHEWVGSLDSQSSIVANTSPGNLGTVLTSLQVSLPGTVVAAWLKAPTDPKAKAYMDMSRNIQYALRRFTQLCYFSDPSNYANLATAADFIVYGCLPLSTDVVFDQNGGITLNHNGDVYWAWEDKAVREKMVYHPSTTAPLSVRISGIRDILRDSDKLQGSAKFYDPKFPDDARKAAMSDPVNTFHGLLFTEATTIASARDAAVKLAKFMQKAGTDPEQAIEVLDEFAAKITDAFNQGLGQSLPRLREFSSMIFLEAARSFDPAGGPVQPLARLDTMLLKPSAASTVIDDFLAGKAPGAADLGFEQPIIGLP